MEKNSKTPIYPVEDFQITEQSFELRYNYRNETTFALSNGYIGTRGTFEEGYDFSVEEGLEGNFINGFYESEDIRYGEWNFGFPTKSQSLLNLPNVKTTEIYLDGERFDMRAGSVKDYRRTLCMKEGILRRSLTWTSGEGREVRLCFERLVSFCHKNVMAQRVHIIPLSDIETIKIRSCLDADVENHTRVTNPLVDYGPFGKRIVTDISEGEAAWMYFEGTTRHSRLTAACAAIHNVQGDSISGHTKSGSDGSEIEWIFSAKEEITVDKFIVYTSSLDMEKERLHDFTREQCDFWQQKGFDFLKGGQAEYMADFWRHADVTIEGDDALQQGIRFNLFHIMQAAGRDGKTGLGAKGLSGEGYEGHYFWDTEMYALPVFTYTAPKLAKKLLLYRYETLPKARDRARVLGHEKGALYPWRTINGEEASTYFPLGTAQYHINGDIAYAFWQYTDVTGDMEFLKKYAAEVLCETARVWADVGSFADCRGGRYCICAVTGPDEYNAIVDNNFYTNLMARENIRYALTALSMLRESGDGSFEALVEKLGITEDETALWQRIVENMYFPYDEKRKVYPLDDGFLMRKPWDDSKIPPEKRHLLYENYHPLFIYRQRMSKQADAILGMYLHSNFFTQQELRDNYDFYQEVTLHHSSLSTCIFGIVACQIERYEDAYKYFVQSARMDLDDYHNNFFAGIHAANMAGTWQAIVNGFAGLRTNGGILELRPYLPSAWKGYSFALCYRGNEIRLLVYSKSITVTLLKGKGLSLWLNGREITLSEDKPEVKSEKQTEENEVWNEKI